MPLENRGLSLRSFRRLQPRNVARLQSRRLAAMKSSMGNKSTPRTIAKAA